MNKLCNLSPSKLRKFINSFDIIFSDINGVLTNNYNDLLPGSAECFRLFKDKLGKPIKLVSNNSLMSRKQWVSFMQNRGYNLEYEDFVNPGAAIVDHLKAINFNKEIFVVGFESIRQEARDAGFKVTKTMPERIEEKLDVFLNNLKDEQKIGAVIFDWNVTMTYLELLKAAIYLNRPDVFFYTGRTDERITFDKNIVIGPKYFQDILENFSKRTAISFGKPSMHLNEYLNKKYKISENKRVLFIGDSPSEDIAFAKKCGYQTLLVSKLPNKNNLDILCEEEKPDYYVESLGYLEKLIMEKYFKSNIII